jgi:hypothetical protein
VLKTFQLFALALVLACASGTGGRVSSSEPNRPFDRNLITEEELAAVPSGNLYEAIEKIRPAMLRSRGAVSFSGQATNEYAEVYVDGRKYGDITSLRSIVTSQVGGVRYYGSSDAAAKFGMINGSGVISVAIKQ